MLRSTNTTALLILCLCVGIAGADDDIVKTKLETAKAAYEKEKLRLVESVSDFLDKREEAARKAGNKKAVDQVKSERKAFEETGDLPSSFPLKMKQQAALSRSTMQKAYEAAISEYTKAKKDDEAGAIEKEVEQFKTMAVGTATVGAFAFTGKWREGHASGFTADRLVTGKFVTDTAGKKVYAWRQEKEKLILQDLTNPAGVITLTIDKANPKTLRGQGQTGVAVVFEVRD